MIVLNSHKFSAGGRRIDFQYTVSGKALLFLRPEESFFIQYDEDVSSCPPSLLVVPFLANFAPIAWFGGFDIEVPEVDEAFNGSLVNLRDEFQKMYPSHRLTGQVISRQVARNHWESERVLQLFSGGLDAYDTLIRHRGKPLELVTIQGADVDLTDAKQWSERQRHITSDPLPAQFIHHTIRANLRTFYTVEVELRLAFQWWGRVQHGLGLVGLLAPLSYLRRSNTGIIASTFNYSTAWGSTKKTDEKISWAGFQCIHDGALAGRQEKTREVVAFTLAQKTPVTLSVCYSEKERDGNCGKCEKCYRTITNLIVAGGDPRNFGFPLTDQIFSDIFNKMAEVPGDARGLATWQEIADAAEVALTQKSYPDLFDRTTTQQFLQRLASGEVTRFLAKNQPSRFRPSPETLLYYRSYWPRGYILVREIVNFLKRITSAKF